MSIPAASGRIPASPRSISVGRRPTKLFIGYGEVPNRELHHRKAGLGDDTVYWEKLKKTQMDKLPRELLNFIETIDLGGNTSYFRSVRQLPFATR